MTDQEALAFCDDLRNMAGEGPGDVPGTQDRLDKIGFQFRSHADGYVREKAFDAIDSMRIWRSPRRWRQWGADSSALRASLLNAIAKLRDALISYNDRSGCASID